MLKKDDFGDSESQSICLYKIFNSSGESVFISTLGATIVSINLKDRDGNLRDVCLGYDDPQDYLENEGYIGASIGRYANRISRGKFTLNGIEYRLERNDGSNHLHGGTEGFDKKVWQLASSDENSITLSYYSEDGEEGYSGNLKVKAKFTFDDSGTLSLLYTATTDADTIVNLTNHCYFNLNGSGDILNHELYINADSITATDGNSIPTGEIMPVAGTAFDFTKSKTIGQDINMQDEQLIWAEGYDHNYVLNNTTDCAADLYSSESGIGLKVFTEKEGIQLYTGNYLQTTAGKNGVTYSKRGGVCLETQHFPDSINRENFPSPILRAGENYSYETKFVFYIK